MSSPSKIGITLGEAGDFVYHPGDTVSGTAWLRSNTDEEVDEISVIFRGLTLVRYSAGEKDIGRTGLKSSEDSVPFFENEKTLVRGRQTLPAGATHEWPFEFSWSKSTYQDFSGVRMGEEREVFDMKPHELPPSLLFEEGTVSGGIFYEVEIKLQQPGKDPVTRIEDVNFNQYGDRPSINGFEHRSQTFYANIAPISNTGERRRSSIFRKNESSSKQQRLKFTTDMAVPKLVPIGHPVPVSVQLKHDITNAELQYSHLTPQKCI